MLNNLKQRKNEGFTIIEVMIVLAIAGLILLIVFLAVPALQRNARNTATKNDASALGAGISEFRSNNDGKNPSTITGTGTLTIGAAPDVTSQAKVQGSVQPISAVAATATNTVVFSIGTKCDGTASARAVSIHYWTEQSSGGVGTKCIDS